MDYIILIIWTYLMLTFVKIYIASNLICMWTEIISEYRQKIMYKYMEEPLVSFTDIKELSLTMLFNPIKYWRLNDYLDEDKRTIIMKEW